MYDFGRLQCRLEPNYKFGSKGAGRKRRKKADCQPTWKRKEAHSKIDTIWVDGHWRQSIIFCKTKDIDLRTEEYQAILSKELKRKLSKDIGKENAQTDILDYQLLESKTLDELWDIIKSSIKKSAANTLL
ncbi:4475_t:CDS:2 [Gigaspora margarita]|uniref:4475_t:CDS:1 n=1 Tax=Gigaspora margarita TaxID=4874 RepID=A0ABN7VBF9_GIGMA|nr:4475_t:CDS:2 [Gigaspora margarita]